MYRSGKTIISTRLQCFIIVNVYQVIVRKARGFTNCLGDSVFAQRIAGIKQFSTILGIVDGDKTALLFFRSDYFAVQLLHFFVFHDVFSVECLYILHLDLNGILWLILLFAVNNTDTKETHVADCYVAVILS